MPRLLRGGAATARSIARCSAPSSSTSSSVIRASLLKQRIEPEAGPSTSTVTPKLASILQRGESSSSTSASLLRSRLSSSTSTSTSTYSSTSLLSSRYPSLSLLLSSSNFHPCSASTSITHTQIRTVTYGSEYQPSQRVRKRRHGFLARRRSKGGKKVLIRRRMKGRRFLSH